jgi:Ni,Fe-hydrogenase III small subunit
MWRQYLKILKTGIPTEGVRKIVREPEVERLGAQIQRQIAKRFARSLAIRQVDAGSCNGCELEIHALNNVYYDIERFGVHFVASPRHADVLLVTGPVARHMEEALRRTYQAAPAPKWVIACGDCAVCGGEFGVNYASLGAVENVLPVDVKIPGCPPTPAQLLAGLLQTIEEKD